MSERQFFIRQGEKVQGPFAEERLRGWIEAGRVRPEMELSEDGTNFRRATEFPGLFSAAAIPIATASPKAAAPRRRERDGEEAPRRSLSASRPPPPASIVAIGCRLLGVIALVAALAVGQWAHVARPTGDPGGEEERVIFGLTEAVSGTAQGSVFTPRATLTYSTDTTRSENDSRDPAPGVPAPPPVTSFHSGTSDLQGVHASAVGTSRLLGTGIGGLVLLAVLLAIGAFGELFGVSKLARLSAFALLAAMGASALAWLFLKSGLVDLLTWRAGAQGGGRLPVTASGGFSFYTSILAVLLLAIAWTRSRVLAMDAARRAHLPPPPKRRRAQSRTGPS